MKKIYLSPSDQNYNTYAVGDTNEAVQCRKIALKLVEALKRCGFEAMTNTTCDMDIMDVKAIHYAFLSTWTQICSWAYYFHPWFLPEEVEETIRK